MNVINFFEALGPVLIFLLGAAVLIKNIKFKRSGVEVIGTIVAVKENLSLEAEASEKVRYIADFEFIADGKTVTVTDAKLRKRPPRIGRRVKVVYQPANPAGARVYRFFEFYGAWLITMLVGALLFADVLREIRR